MFPLLLCIWLFNLYRIHFILEDETVTEMKSCPKSSGKACLSDYRALPFNHLMGLGQATPEFATLPCG